jgi:hypothetical protein
MSRLRSAAVLTLVLALLPATAAADDARRVWLSLGGGAALGTIGWTGISSWEEYRETAELEADYEAGPGPALEAAVGVRVAPRFGLRAAFGWSSRDVDATVRAGIPHPLYFDRPRELSDQVTGLAYRQWAGHLDLEWRPVIGKLEVTLFGGVCLARIEADLVDRVEVDDEYPFDTVSLSSAVTRRVRSDPGTGWSAGAAVAHALGSRLSLGVQLRYTRVPLDLALDKGRTSSVEAGGLQLTAMLRVGL